MTDGSHITGNLYGLYREAAALCSYASGRVAGCDYVWNRQGSWPAYLLGNPVPDKMDEALEAMESKEVPPFWMMEKRGTEAEEKLDQAGVRTIREWKGMILQGEDSLHLSRTGAPGGPEEGGLRLRPVEKDREREDWLGIVNGELMTASRIDKGFLEAVSGRAGFDLLLAYREGKPVATGLSYARDGVCGLYMIATRSSFRGRGIGTRITRELIEGAIRSGNRSIVLHATEAGGGIYRRLGFREVNHISVRWFLGH
jgi:ribosomal protein S18 acetylase RimI-like enzyme